MNKILPNLMPFQLEPFNGDTIAQVQVLNLKFNHGIDRVIETGTCLGGTTLWLAQHFKVVATVENNKQYQDMAVERCAYESSTIAPIYFKLGDSAKCLGEVIRDTNADDKTLFFFDAHWKDNWPIIDELTWLLFYKLKPVIMIHDFKVPGTDLQFDTFRGQPLDFEYIKVALNAIYGDGCYDYHYNSTATGARVGIIYIYPKAA